MGGDVFPLFEETLVGIDGGGSQLDLVGAVDELITGLVEADIPLATILFQCKEYRNVKNSVYFRFLKDGDIKPPRLVIQYDYNTDKIINKFYDSGNASEETNISPSTISHQCSKRNKPQRKPKSGYYFMYG